MRISNKMLVQNALRNIRTNLEALDRSQREAATGRRIQKASDDPIDAAQIMRIDSSLRDIDQYQRNGISATAHLSTEDAVLTNFRQLISSAKDMAIGGATQDPDNPLRQVALTQIRNIRDQVISLGNTKLGEEYIFGGTRTDTPPFAADGSYRGNSTTRLTEIDDGALIATGHPGDAVFSDSLAALDNLARELESGTTESINTAVSALGDTETGVLSTQAEVGSRLSEIQDAGTRLASRSGNLMDRRGDLRDADPAESLVKVMAAQTALERAYEVIGRVLSTSILDHL
jgi:flagellar hook-associated protein 3 FlgL